MFFLQDTEKTTEQHLEFLTDLPKPASYKSSGSTANQLYYTDSGAERKVGLQDLPRTPLKKNIPKRNAWMIHSMFIALIRYIISPIMEWIG